MKQFLFLIMLFGLSQFAANAQNPNTNAAKNQPEIKFETVEHDFGTIKEGADCTFEFKFSNSGKTPLIISNAIASCGCTVPTWSKNPIPKKKTGTITVKYDSHRLGAFEKTISVYSNAKTNPVTLKIKGNVIQ